MRKPANGTPIDRFLIPGFPVAPFTKTRTVEDVCAWCGDETCDDGIHPFQTDRAGGELVDRSWRDPF